MKRFFLFLILLPCIIFTGCRRNNAPVIEPLEELGQLEGQWECDGFSVEYPFEVNNRIFLKVDFNSQNDSDLWYEYAEKYHLTIEEVWQKKNSALCQIYNKEYPFVGDNGIQKGMKLLMEKKEDNTQILSTVELLIPSELIEEQKSLISFEKTDESCKLLAADFVDYYDLALEIPACKGEYGLVLSGGGGKGAYEAGAWKAFYEYGIAPKITCISGASVGGLNAALFACIDNPEEIAVIWEKQVPGNITKNNEILSQEGLLEIIDTINLKPICSQTFPFVFVDALRTQTILDSLFKGSKLEYFCLNHRDAKEVTDMLLATSAFPIVTDPVLLSDGFYYLDGGYELLGGDNTPFYPITEMENPQLNIKTMFIVSLNNDDEFYLEEKDTVEYLYHITPSQDLGSLMDGILNFSKEKILSLMNLGYNDTVQYLEKKGYVPVPDYWFN